MFGRMLAGAGAGAGLGYMEANGNYGRAIGGGALGGAIAAGPGVLFGRKALGMLPGGGVAGAGQWGLGQGLRAVGVAQNRWGSNRFSAVGNALAESSHWLGNNAITTNKYAGIAMAGLGTASAANIGSTVLSSNSGF